MLFYLFLNLFTAFPANHYFWSNLAEHDVTLMSFPATHHDFGHFCQLLRHCVGKGYAKFGDSTYVKAETQSSRSCSKWMRVPIPKH